MKIELEIPDDYKDNNIYVMAGIQLVAYKHRGGEWMIKTRRCNLCGDCCASFTGRHVFPVVDGACVHLLDRKQTRICRLGVNRPFGCCIAIVNKERFPNCTEEFTPARLLL